MAMTESEIRRFNEWVANRDTELRVVGSMEDGTAVLVRVPKSLGLDK